MEAEQAETPQVGAKRKASEMDDELADEYMCPITQELPVEPCIAEDGHLYDQWALEKWMDAQEEVRSPMTNKSMGKKLYPAVQARNAIHRLINKGLIAGAGAERWKARQVELEAMTPSMRVTVGKAFKGDVPSMRVFGFAYRDGLNGVKKDIEGAWEWFKLAAEKDDAMAIVSIGVFFMNGTGVIKDEANGMVWLTRAAMLGSEHACLCLGQHYKKAVVFRTKYYSQTRYWYEKSLRCSVKDSTKSSRELREAWFKEHGGVA